MLTIKPIKPTQVAAAKQIIAQVAGRIFEPHKTTEEFAAILESEHELDDLDHIEQVYGQGKGLFLAVEDEKRLVGIGAIKPLEGQTAELKRIWLLEEYHGRGIGYRLVTRLLEFASEAGYRRVVLQTSLEQVRALAFYRRLGFVEITPYYQTPWDDEIFMGLELDMNLI
ncbi:MAG TPA: GNAT family N-acetyltransferase [Anaerolineales bacterium]